MKRYIFKITVGGNDFSEARQTFRYMLENEYKVWRAFEIEESE